MNSQDLPTQMSNRGSTRAKSSTNFSAEERRRLVGLANKYRSTLENTKTDQITTAAKSNAWITIEEEFNIHGLGPHRDHITLKFTYEAIKRELRKNTSEWRSTGGGPPSGKMETPLTEEEKILRGTIISVEGLEPGVGDSDTACASGVSTTQVEYDITDEPFEMDWAGVTPRMLQTPVHPALPVSALETEVTNSDAPKETEGTKERTPKAGTMLRLRRTVQKKSRASASRKIVELAERKIKLTQKKERLLDLQIRKAELEREIAERTLAKLV